MTARAEVWSAIERRELSRLGDRPTPVAVHAAPGEAAAVLSRLGGRGYAFAFADTVLARASASAALALLEDPAALDAELVDAGLLRSVRLMLGRLEQLHIYMRTSAHDVAVLGMSLAPPRSLINGRPRRTAEETMRRAVEAFTIGLELPVIMPAGNDGPEPGFLNPWATGRGTLVVTAADAAGEQISQAASRPAPSSDELEGRLFAAHGVDVVTARDTRYERHLPVDPDIAARFGEERARWLRKVTGTSFATPQVARTLCRLHQATEFLRSVLSSGTGPSVTLPAYIGAIVDYAIDRNHPDFDLRQAERSRKYSGLQVEFELERRQALWNAVIGTGVDVDLRLRPEVARRFLTTIARPMPEAGDAAGSGFLEAEAADAFIARLRVSDVVRLFADTDDVRTERWIATLAREGDPTVLPPSLAAGIPTYCENHSLILALPLALSE